jgi:catechol 2,3-dioxygenase-like lactoylglutathione lyase family enzyme
VKTEFFGVAPLLQVYDMPTAVHFYRDLLGFELVNQSRDGEEFDWCLLSRNGAEIMLNTMYEPGHRPSQPDARRTAVHADAGLYFACRELDSAYEHLTANGVRVDPPRAASYGMRQLSFKDPDGYEICFQWPADERWAQQWRPDTASRFRRSPSRRKSCHGATGGCCHFEQSHKKVGCSTCH